MSDFDPKDIVNEEISTSDFDPKDIIRDDEVSSEIEQQPEPIQEPDNDKLMSSIQQVSSPAIGYAAGKTAQKIASKIVDVLYKSGELAAKKIGGLSPEQVEYYKQNYKAMEANGITPESIQKTMGELENTFKGKNLQATMALSEAEKLSPTPLTREVAETAVKEALPELLPKIKTEEEPFQKKLKSRISEKQTAELQRLENLLKENELALINSKEYAQIKAEEAGQKAVQEAKKANKKISLTTKPIDEKSLYNEAFDKALVTAKKEESQLIKKLESNKADIVKEALESAKKDRTLEATEELLRQYQTPLANKYPSLKGRESKVSINQAAIDKMLTDLSDVTTKKGKEAFDFLRELSKQGWTPDSGVSNELAAKVREKLRAQLSPEGTLSNEKFKEVSKLLTELEAAESAGFIERTSGKVDTNTLEGKISKFSPESVKIGQAEQQFIKRVLNPSAKDMQNVDIQEARKLFDQLVADPALVDKVKQAAVKMDLLDPTKLAKFGATDAFRVMIGTSLGQYLPVLGYEGVKSLKTPMGAYKAATLGSRISDVIPAGVKTFGKGLGQVVPVLGTAAGAYFGYQEAKEEGLPEWASIPYAGFEAISPAPISPIQAKKAMEESAKERAKNISQNYEMSPEEIEQSKQTSQAIKNILPSWMTKKENNVTFTSAKPEDVSKILESLSMSNDKASQEYSRVLSQIVNASPREKESILFGLNQQPAFRELVRKAKGEQNTED